MHDVQEFIKGKDCEYDAYLEPGQYVVLPRTNGIALKRPTGAIPENISLLNEKGELSDIFEGTLEDIYYRLDTMISNSIDYDEFKELYDTVGQSITQQDFTTNIISKYCSTDKGLTLKGFKDFFRDQVKTLGDEAIWQ